MPGTASKNKRRLWIAGGLLLAALTVLLLLPGDRKDSRVDTLSQKLIDTETNNIRQMRPFL